MPLKCVSENAFKCIVLICDFDKKIEVLLTCSNNYNCKHTNFPRRQLVCNPSLYFFYISQKIYI